MGSAGVSRRLLLSAMVSLGLLPGLAARAAEPGAAIIITGTRPEKLLAELAACRENCPPERRLELALAAGEALFVAGDYRKARAVVRDGLRRDGATVAPVQPVLVAGTHRALARINAHLGDGPAALRASYDIAGALKAGLLADDPRIAYASIEAADMLVKVGRINSAERAYAPLARLPAPVGPVAELRLAWLAFIEGDVRLAQAKIATIAASDDPALRPFRLPALVLAARIAADADRDAAVNAAIAEARMQPATQKPVIVLDPPVQLAVNSISEGEPGFLPVRTQASQSSGPNADGQWADVGLRIAPDGRVMDVAVLRSRGGNWWHPAVRAAIGARRYAPFASADPEGAYRLERFTLTSWLEPTVGSRIERHSSQVRIERLDLTDKPQ